MIGYSIIVNGSGKKFSEQLMVQKLIADPGVWAGVLWSPPL